MKYMYHSLNSCRANQAFCSENAFINYTDKNSIRGKKTSARMFSIHKLNNRTNGGGVELRNIVVVLAVLAGLVGGGVSRLSSHDDLMMYGV